MHGRGGGRNMTLSTELSRLQSLSCSIGNANKPAQQNKTLKNENSSKRLYKTINQKSPWNSSSASQGHRLKTEERLDVFSEFQVLFPFNTLVPLLPGTETTWTSRSDLWLLGSALTLQFSSWFLNSLLQMPRPVYLDLTKSPKLCHHSWQPLVPCVDLCLQETSTVKLQRMRPRIIPLFL